MRGSGIGGEALLLQQSKTRPFVGDVPINKNVVFEWQGAWKGDFETCAKCGFVDEDRQYISGDCPECGNGGQVVMRAQSLGEKFKEEMVFAIGFLAFFGCMAAMGFGVWWLYHYNCQR